MTGARLRWAEVDLSAVAHNVGQVRRHLGETVTLMAVVKADGYGHGSVAVARAAVAAGAGWLGVATLDEAAALRAGGLDSPVLLMGPTPAGREAEAIALDLRLCVYDREGIARVAAAAGEESVRLHLKVDTGMARLGCRPDEALILARSIQAAPGLELEGLWTHFAEADDRASPRTAQQLGSFLGVVAELASGGVAPALLHAANSAAGITHEAARLSMVRCGLPVYGYASAPGMDQVLELRPALEWKSRVVAVHDLQPGDRVGYGGTFAAGRPTRVATVSTGYADGYPRVLSNRGEVLLGGRRAAVVGRVSMDYMTVDASAVPEVGVGDEVVIVGSQGDERISAADLAAAIDGITWEVLTMIGPRVERVLVGA